jgi:hypothetical protein
MNYPVFTSHNHTKFNIPISNGSLPIATQPKAKYVYPEGECVILLLEVYIHPPQCEVLNQKFYRHSISLQPQIYTSYKQIKQYLQYAQKIFTHCIFQGLTLPKFSFTTNSEFYTVVFLRPLLIRIKNFKGLVTNAGTCSYQY